MANTIPPFVQLDSKKASLIIDCRDKTPAILYWGKRLNAATKADMISLLGTRQEAKCSPKVEAPISLSPCMGEGFTGGPGIELSAAHNAWSVGGELQAIEHAGDQTVS